MIIEISREKWQKLGTEYSTYIKESGPGSYSYSYMIIIMDTFISLLAWFNFS